MQFPPFIEGKINYGQSGRRQFFPQMLAGVDVARRNQHQCQCMQARIVAHNKKDTGGRIGRFDDI